MRRSARSSQRAGNPVVALADQIASSASNALIVLAVAGVSTPGQVGAFGVAYAVVAMLLTIERSMFAAQVSLHAPDGDAIRRETRHALASLVVLAPLSVVSVLVAGALVGSGVDPLVIALALGAPIALMQDLLRFTAVALGRPSLALVSDSIWLVVSLGAFAWRVLGDPTGGELVLLWVIGGLIALVSLMQALPAGPRFVGLGTWLRESWVHRARLSTAAVSASVSVALTALVVGHVAGLAVYGALAGAGQLLAPVNVLIAFIAISVVPRAMHLPVSQRPSAFRGVAWKIFAVGVGTGLVLYALPNPVGEALLGATWPSAHAILPVLGLQYGLVAVYSAATGLLMTLSRARAVMLLGLGIALVRIVLSAAAAAAIPTAMAQAWMGTVIAFGGAVAYWWVAGRAVGPRSLSAQREGTLPATDA